MRTRLTPDGVRYLALGGGVPQPVPFHLRRLLPLVCGNDRDKWVVANIVGISLSAYLTVVLAILQGATMGQGVLAAGLFLSLPWVRFCFRCPVLVDMPALALALLTAVTWLTGHYGLALFTAFVAGAASEKAPVWAAVFAWHPALLVGLFVPFFVRAFSKPGLVDPFHPLAETLEHPVRSSWKYHRGQWFDARVMLLPWGACLLAAANPSPQLFVALAVGYAQLIVATDSVRLYQHAAPVVAIAAATALPLSVPLLAVIVAAQLRNPWREAQP